jgi:hypothetical protein
MVHENSIFLAFYLTRIRVIQSAITKHEVLVEPSGIVAYLTIPPPVGVRIRDARAKIAKITKIM